ncbi:C4-dicarboxylate ABC transporter [Azospirillum sp. TSH100]|uniref:sigma-54-dependent transcriptional regulator n=1 Tax=Azospirillum sp. TSH100 TaxID=652764 RepID=UPI000D61CF8A|nr:sigma-54 dependent transcriptional regulator [Azospirillum sp. TSH100]PWC80620.1 C4-dicarboxylate ABC transporter [Azospirillum sp. TSH100]QCG91871.1 sigma-54-dependent Fis family transcriptional regulator [Azospirillum sp. TSH100]
MKTDPSATPVLFIDDELAMRLSVTQWLQLAGFAAQGFETPQPALDLLSPDFPGVLVTDVRMPRMDGMAVLERALERDADLPVILVTGHGDVALAVEAMRRGAYDFIEKPFEPDHLVAVLRRAAEKRRLVLENRGLRRRTAGGGIETRLIGTSPAIAELRRDLIDLAATSASVLIHGETGTGKELVARCLHDFGPRGSRGGEKGAFVAVNCGAIPDSMAESELFGHEPGAFTGATQRRAGKLEHSSGGTLFLDEIESMPLAIQVKLLRALQERTIERLGSNKQVAVDLRLVAATKIDLLDLSEEGRFRSDLYYRLNVAELHIPPLRARTEDIPLLFDYFAAEFAARHGREPRPLEAADLDALLAHDWPGNVRELRNLAERHVLSVGRSGVAGLLRRRPVGGEGATAPRALADQVDAFEKRAIEQALERCKGDIKAVMDLLDIPRRTLNEKMARHGLDRTRYLPRG